jgi:glycosyltransferase involved in cell wall biosynthesis
VAAVKLHTVFITHNRLELTKRAIASYLETVRVPFTFCVSDNASTDGTREWLLESDFSFHLLNENRYPGYATNGGWSNAPANATHLHRADNDHIFLPGWCEEVQERFESDRKIGQVGLRTAAEEGHIQQNTGGNCVIRRELWDEGLRWDERTWPQLRDEIAPGHTEDSLFSPAVKAMGYRWTRVKRPCIQPISPETPDDPDWPYYVKSFTDRGIHAELIREHS